MRRRKFKQLAEEIWGSGEAPAQLTERQVGKGRVFWSAAFQKKSDVAQDRQGAVGLGPMDLVSRRQSGRFRPAGQALFPKNVHGRWRSEIGPIGHDRRQRVHRLDRRPASRAAAIRTRGLSRSTSLPLLKQGENLLAVEAVNTTDVAIARRIDRHAHDSIQGRPQADHRYRQDLGVGPKRSKENWNSDADAGDGWTAAKELGPLGMAPWGNLDAAAPSITICIPKSIS